MSILGNLNPCFKIEASEPASTEQELQELIEYSPIAVPDDYLSIIRLMTEVEILTTTGKYFRVWSSSGCIEMNEEYEVQDYIPNSLAIGDDEGGSALIIMSGKEGFGLYKVGFGDLDIDKAEYISESLSDLLILGVGVNKI